MPEWLTSWLPTLFMLLLVVTILAAARWIFAHRFAGVAGRAVHRQGLTALLVFVAVLAVVVTLPIDPSTRGHLLSLIGLLVSAAIALSSTTFIGNMMAGVLLRVVRNFRPGDFVQVEGHFGRVSEQGLLHTEIQTEDRDLVTLPNLFLVNHPVRVTRASGTVVSADVSLGYDVAHHRAETALLAAAEAAGLSEPFVRIVDLGDFSVSYRVAGILTEVRQLLTARSLLRANMLDSLHAAGIEIVSPIFHNQRPVPKNRLFMPPAKGGEPGMMTGDEIFPEQLVFDKADRAESLEKLRAAHEALDVKVDELAAQLKHLPEGPEKEALQRRVDRARELRERLTRRINETDNDR